MIGTPEPERRFALPQAVSFLGTQRFTTTVLAALALSALLVAALAMLGWRRAEQRWATEARVTYVKLAPSGTWVVEQDVGQQVVYFESTVRNILYDWTRRRYSKVSATILDDWAIAYAMYSPSQQSWFQNDYHGTQVAADHAACTACPQTKVRVRTHQHIDPLPERPGEADSAPVRTLLYGSESIYSPGSAVPSSSARKLYQVTWRMLSKATIQSKPDLLLYDPLGIEILDVEVTDDNTDGQD